MRSGPTKDQRDRAVAWLREHPDFATEPGRLALRSAAFAARSGAESLLDLDLSGDPGQAAERLVERLRAFGCLDGRHALGLVLEPLTDRLGDDRRPTLETLIRDLDLHCTRPAVGQPCPYLGLNAFREADAPWFFGRELFVDALVRAVDACPVVAVIGPSGSGKSSVVQAGLFPVLRQRSGWTLASLRPGHDPWSALAGCFCDLLGLQFDNDLERARETKRLGAELAAATRARGPDQGALGPADLMRRIIDRQPRPGRLLLLVDQWEELYTHDPARGPEVLGEPQSEPVPGHGDEPPAEIQAEPLPEHFANALIGATTGAPCTLVLTLRADFYHRLLEHRRLADAVRGAGHVDLSPMNGDELQRAILEPARRAGLAFESGLPERILEDLGQEPGLLPLLELCLTRLWERRQDSTLSAAAYGAIGGVRGAIIQAAEAEMEGLGPLREGQVRDLFLRLVQLDDAAPDTRRRATRTEVGESAWPLAQRLADTRLLVTGRDPASGEQTLEVAHEALIRFWPRLRGWLADARDGLRLQTEIRRAARLWEGKGRAPDHRWPDSRVMEAAPALRRIADRFPLGERERAFLGPLEAEELLARLEDPATTHAERAMIGDRLGLLPGGDPRPGVDLGEDGLPDILWCQVPGGEVELSVEPGRPRLLDRLRGRRAGRPRFAVVPFQMAKYSITVAQWQAFLDDPDGYDRLIRSPYGGVEPGGQRGRANQPAVNLAWVEAMAFCDWLTERVAPPDGLVVRLPAEWEWQQAACSGHSDHPAWAYPWGPDWAEGLANTFESELGRMVAVGLYPAGRSEQGVMDLAGNAWDWCLNEHGRPEQTTPGGTESRVLRGGSWGSARGGARAVRRDHDHPGSRTHHFGFRVLCASPIR
jgi:formylglycine-generating enzyme required for sulfatase activity